MLRTTNRTTSNNTCTTLSWQWHIAIIWRRKRVSPSMMGLWRNWHNLWILQRKNVDQERLEKLNKNNPQFSLCCENGKVMLPSLPATLQKLEVFVTNKERSAVKFRDQIRMYNLVLAFTSFGAKVDESITRGIGPYSFRIQGEFYHKIGSMCPVKG